MTTEEKQNFLREKILDKGYDTNQFVQFLTEKKGEDGADVSNWSMEDLVSVVNEFIKLNGGVVEPEPEPKVEKKLKVSMFDIMGGAKPKKNISQPLPNPQKNPQIETQKVNSNKKKIIMYKTDSNFKNELVTSIYIKNNISPISVINNNISNDIYILNINNNVEKSFDNRKTSYLLSLIKV